MARPQRNKANDCNLSVKKACQIVDMFTDYRDKLSMKDIAEEFGVTSSTILPILHSLEDGGYLSRNETTKQYSLGMRFVEKSRLVISRLDLRDQAVYTIRDLSLKYNVSTNVGILDDNEVVFIDCQEASPYSRRSRFIGVRIPVYCTALGKVMLAYLDSAIQYRILERTELKRFTPKTKVDISELLLDLVQIRKQGYSIDDEEFKPGGICIGAPVFDSSKQVSGAISISIAKYPDNPDRVAELIKATVEAAAEISTRMGYRA